MVQVTRLVGVRQFAGIPADRHVATTVEGVDRVDGGYAVWVNLVEVDREDLGQAVVRQRVENRQGADVVDVEGHVGL